MRTSEEASDQRSCDWPAVGSVLSLDLRVRAKHHFSCANSWPGDKYTLLNTFKWLPS